MTEKELLELLLKKFDNLEQDVQEIKQDNKTIHTKLDNLEMEIKQNTVAVETTIQKCIDVIGEGYQMTSEKVDRLNIDSMLMKLNKVEMLCDLNKEELTILKRKIS